MRLDLALKRLRVLFEPLQEPVPVLHAELFGEVLVVRHLELLEPLREELGEDAVIVQLEGFDFLFLEAFGHVLIEVLDVPLEDVLWRQQLAYSGQLTEHLLGLGTFPDLQQRVNFLLDKALHFFLLEVRCQLEILDEAQEELVLHRVDVRADDFFRVGARHIGQLLLQCWNLDLVLLGNLLKKLPVILRLNKLDPVLDELQQVLHRLQLSIRGVNEIFELLERVNLLLRLFDLGRRVGMTCLQQILVNLQLVPDELDGLVYLVVELGLVLDAAKLVEHWNEELVQLLVRLVLVFIVMLEEAQGRRNYLDEGDTAAVI